MIVYLIDHPKRGLYLRATESRSKTISEGGNKPDGWKQTPVELPARALRTIVRKAADGLDRSQDPSSQVRVFHFGRYPSYVPETSAAPSA